MVEQWSDNPGIPVKSIYLIAMPVRSISFPCAQGWWFPFHKSGLPLLSLQGVTTKVKLSIESFKCIAVASEKQQVNNPSLTLTSLILELALNLSSYDYM